MKKTLQAVSIVILSFLIITLTSKTYQATDSNPPYEAKIDVLKSIGNLPAFFIENQGQLPEEVGYYFKGKDTLYFTNQGVTFQKVVMESGPPQADVAGNSLDSSDHVAGKPSAQTLAYKLEFAGASPTAPVAKSELEGKVNYFIGNDPSRWHTNIPTYQEIVYPGVYGGPESVPARHSERSEESRPFAIAQGDTNGLIDLVYKGIPGRMKYEFIVHPGANPDDIRLAYTGIEGLSIDDSGNLIIHTALGDVKDEKPYTYQEIDGQRVEVECRFIMESSDRVAGKSIDTVNGLQKTVYGFAVGDYDPHYSLVIDPGLQYSTFLGGGDRDWGYDIALDSSGNAFMTGYTQSGDFPTTPGAYDRSRNGGVDAFVTKLNPTSGVVYSTFLGGGVGEWGRGIALDSSGNVFVTGYTWSGDFPTTPGAYDRSYNGGRDVFVTKLNPTSGVVYSTFLGGGDSDEGYGIALNSSGNAFVVGATSSGDFPTTPGAYDRSHNGNYDAFVTRLDPFVSGEVVWENYFNREGSLADGANSVATRGTSVFVAGYTTTTTGGRAFSVRAYNTTNGTLLWQNHFDRQGSLVDAANSVVVSGDGSKVFAAGYTSTTAGGDAFSVRAHNATNGTLLWQNHLDREGSLEDAANSVVVSGDGSKVFAAGYTTTTTGGRAFSVRAYNATTGALLWQNHYDREGSQNDEANAVAINGAGDKVFVAGFTRTSAGGRAFSVRAYNTGNGTLLWQNYLDKEGSLWDTAYSVAVSGDGTKVFAAGYTSTSAGGQAFSIRAYNATNGTLLWQNHFDRQGSLDDAANSVVVSPDSSKVFVAGFTRTSAGGPAFSVRAHNATNGTPLWQNYLDREGGLADVANSVAISGDGTKVFAAGYTSTSAGGPASSVGEYNATNGTLLWQDHLDREGSLADVANSVAVMGNSDVFVAGYTTTTSEGQAFAVRALRQ